MSIATSYAAISASSVYQFHDLKVYLNGNLVFGDSVQGPPTLVGTDPLTLERTYETTINYTPCGVAAGSSVHTFVVPPPFGTEVMNRGSVDDVWCTEEEVAEPPSGDGGGGTNEPQDDLWCWFLCIYDGSGRLVSRDNTGICWRM